MIQGFTVCVNYADLLSSSCYRWVTGLDDWVIITTPDDVDTHVLCHMYGIKMHLTTAFFDDGAVFNKAKAMAEAYERFPPTDWVLLIDADIVPPPNWRGMIDTFGPVPGRLYGATRLLQSGERYHEGEIAGYFQLFHSSDRNVKRRPVFDISWRHAGGYDSEFQFRWKDDWRQYIPGLNVTHQGIPGQNWFGRGQTAQMARMLRRRQEHGGVTDDEHIGGP